MPVSTYISCKSQALELTHELQETLENLRIRTDLIVRALLSGDGDINALGEARKMQVEIMNLASISINQVNKLELL